MVKDRLAGMQPQEEWAQGLVDGENVEGGGGERLGESVSLQVDSHCRRSDYPRKWLSAHVRHYTHAFVRATPTPVATYVISTMHPPEEHKGPV